MAKITLPPIFDYFSIMKSVKFQNNQTFYRNAPLSGKLKVFNFQLVLPTDEVFTIERVSPGMIVKELKDRIEVETGIPSHLQRLRYLDDYDLADERRLAFYHVVPAATLVVLLWPEWVEVVVAACKGDYYGLLGSGIRKPISPDSTEPREFNEKATVALYIAAHRGHVCMVSKLVESGVYPCTRLPSGRSPLHAAVNQKHVTCVSILIGRSRGLTEEKTSHDNAVRKSTFSSIANLITKKSGWRLIVQQYGERMRRQMEDSKLPAVPRKEFQKYDSTFPTYLRGPLGRLYLCNILQTEARHAAKRIPRPWY